MTPNDIEVLIHCYYSPVSHPRLDAPAVKGSIKMFLEHKLIKQGDKENVYVTTKGGRALVKLLCSVPFPRQAWVDENDNILDCDY